MTAAEQLAIWAGAPNDQIFIWLQYPQHDGLSLHFGAGDEPSVIGRMRAADVLARFQRTGAANGIARDVLSRFQKRADAPNRMRVDEIKGVTCVIVDGNSPVSPYSPYRLLLSSVESFT